MRAHSLVVALAGSLFGAAGCGNAAKHSPSYEADIKPLMEAHCIRCHGAGGMLNEDPDMKKILAGQPAATNGDFTRLDDANGRHGLMFYTAGSAANLHLYVDTGPMPPPPSSRLTSFEYDTLFNWAESPNPLP
jgi:hypothetical protein